MRLNRQNDGWTHMEKSDKIAKQGYEVIGTIKKVQCTEYRGW